MSPEEKNTREGDFVITGTSNSETEFRKKKKSFFVCMSASNKLKIRRAQRRQSLRVGKYSHSFGPKSLL